MSTYVLVHGGGHGGWCWQRVARVLRAQAHEVYTPTLTGFGERCHLGGPKTPFDTFVTDVAQMITFEDLHDVVLVGHSMGGVVIPRVGGRANPRTDPPSRLAGRRGVRGRRKPAGGGAANA